MSTERPRNSSMQPRKIDPPARSPGLTVTSPSARKRADRLPAAHAPPQSDGSSLRGIFVERDEITDGNGKESVLGSTERVYSQGIFKASDDNCEAQGIETRLQKRQIVSEWR